jgi:hypothetical protein
VPVPPHVFAVAPDRVVYARFVRAPGGLELREHRALPLAPETFTDGLLGGPMRDAAAFSGELGSLLAQLSVTVSEASLVVPDAWLRVALADVEELPRAGESREEVLRWKLKRLVPFRVEDLRLDAVEIAAAPAAAGAGASRRMLLGFALEVLMQQLETAFAGAGVALGWISGASLSLLPAAVRQAGNGMIMVALADHRGYSLLAAYGGQPVLHRLKAWNGRLPEAEWAGTLRRELRLTGSFLAESLPGAPLERVLVVAPRREEQRWVASLAEGLEAPAEPLAPDFGLAAETVGERWPELAPMMGAALREVA